MLNDMVRLAFGFVFAIGLFWAAAGSKPGPDARLAGGSREPEKNGWIQVRLKGTPREVGYQHGYLLAGEIADAHRAVKLAFEHDTKRPYAFFRQASEQVLWPKVVGEYREEILGIAEGLKAKGVKLDVADVVFLNAWNELVPYYLNWHDAQKGVKPAVKLSAPEHCSAFVATGSYTKDGRVVMGHNAWTGYMEGQRWNILFEIQPAQGHGIFMDGYPGMIHSGDDFGMNTAGLMITETTISNFHGFDPAGVPEFVRARQAMQYAGSIDDFARIMKTGNNGGYANTWLVADRNTNEIAELELGLKNVTLKRTRDGYFVGSNFAQDPKLIREETEFPVDDKSISANARRMRWEQLMAEYKGRIDVAAGQRFLADHYDAYAKQEDAASERTLCGHIDESPRGVAGWQSPYAAAGAVQNKVADAAMAEKMTMSAAMGHACGRHFKAEAHVKAHPEFGWQRGVLRDLPAGGWTVFAARGR